MTKRFILSLVTVALCIACERKEADYRVQASNEVIYATLEQPVDSETKVFTDENLKILWHADDRVSIFDHYTFNEEYRFTGETGDNSGTFSWMPNDDFIVGNELPGLWGVYPYQASTKISNRGILTVNLPSEQVYAHRSFGIGANTMVSATADNRTLFKNAGGYLMLKLYGAEVSVHAIKLKGNDGELLAGECLINAPIDGEPVLEMKADASTQELTLSCPTPVSLGASADNYTEFWFVIPPTTFSKGFTITVIGPNGATFEKSTGKCIAIERNMLTRMAPIEVVLSGGDVPPNNEIWYTTSDGRVIEPENPDILDVNIVSNTYEDGKGIILLDGDLTRIGTVKGQYSAKADSFFNNSSTLISIVFPNSLRTLTTFSAYMCQNLKSIVLPERLDFLGMDSFYYCGLESVIVPETERIQYNPFGDCWNLSCFGGPYASNDARSLIKDGVLFSFAREGLTQYTIPEDVWKIGKSVFTSTSLTDVTLPAGLKEIDQNAFSYCRSLKRISLPESLEKLWLVSFYGTGLEEVVLPESLNFLGKNAFSLSAELRSVLIKGSIATIEENPFAECPKLSSFNGEYATEDHRALVKAGCQFSFAPAGLTHFEVLSGIEEIGPRVFYKCKSLESITIPESVKRIGKDAAYGCANLNSIVVRASVPPAGNSQMFDDTNNCPIYVPAASVNAYKAAPYWSDYADRIFPIEGSITASKYLTFTSEGTTTVSLTNYGDNAPVLYYSTDATNWVQWDYSELTFTTGAPLYLCGDNPDGFSHSSLSNIPKYSTFTTTGDKFGVSGDIMALIDKAEDVPAIPSGSCFAHLFDGCEGLVLGPSLPATTLAYACYERMFSGCTSLISAPKLPATTLADRCYYSMFSDCTSMTSAPELPATTLADRCYYSMFWRCTSLTSAPELPATALAKYCYYGMFFGCSSLTSAPKLLATTLVDYCYASMFCDCPSLINAPELPATVLTEGCYYGMFSGCTSLSSAPELHATTLADYCYYGMFSGCTSLSSAPELHATTLANACYATMFSSCTSLTSAPELPATTLADYCYYGMFYGCTSLPSAPELPAAELTEGCYRQMFLYCHKLNYVKCLATDISASDCLTDWLKSVGSTGTFVKSPAMDDWPTGTSGIPTGWTVRDDGVGGGNEDVGYDDLL